MEFAASAATAMRLLPKNERFKSVFSMAEKLGVNPDTKKTILTRQQIVAEMAALMNVFLGNFNPS
jgi:DNA-binding transcriptional regulator YhcF (GntR family)